MFNCYWKSCLQSLCGCWKILEIWKNYFAFINLLVLVYFSDILDMLFPEQKKIQNFHMRISMNFLFWGLTDVLTNFHFAHHTLYVYQCRCQVKRYTRARSELCTVSFTKQVIIAFITNLFIISSLLTQKMWADKRAAKIFNDLLSHSFLPFCWSCNNCLLGVPDKQFGSYFDELVCLPLSILQNILKNELVLHPICFYHIHSKISSLWQWLLD